MKDYTCQHCGGRIQPHSMKCEYCGTQYKIEHNRVYSIETFQNPVATFSAEKIIPYEEIVHYGANIACEYAIRGLVDELVECVAPMMRIETEHDLISDGQKVRATIKVVRPVR